MTQFFSGLKWFHSLFLIGGNTMNLLVHVRARGLKKIAGQSFGKPRARRKPRIQGRSCFFHSPNACSCESRTQSSVRRFDLIEILLLPMLEKKKSNFHIAFSFGFCPHLSFAPFALFRGFQFSLWLVLTGHVNTGSIQLHSCFILRYALALVLQFGKKKNRI